MRRSTYQNSHFPEGTCLRVCTEPAPSPACRAWPGPSHPALLPSGGSMTLRMGGREPGGADGLRHGPEGSPRPRAPPWPRPGCSRGTPCLPGAQGQTLLRACPVPRGCCREQELLPSGPRGCRSTAGRAAACRRVCLWGRAQPAPGMSGLLLENRAPLYPVTAGQGLRILCLQRTKTRGVMGASAVTVPGSPQRLQQARECWAGGAGTVRARLWLRCALQGLGAGMFRLLEGSCQELSEQHGARAA